MTPLIRFTTHSNSRWYTAWEETRLLKAASGLASSRKASQISPHTAFPMRYLGTGVPGVAGLSCSVALLNDFPASRGHSASQQAAQNHIPGCGRQLGHVVYQHLLGHSQAPLLLLHKLDVSLVMGTRRRSGSGVRKACAPFPLKEEGKAGPQPAMWEGPGAARACPTEGHQDVPQCPLRQLRTPHSRWHLTEKGGSEALGLLPKATQVVSDRSKRQAC